MKLTPYQTEALRTLAARGGAITCDTATLGSYTRGPTHCRLLGLGLVRVEVLRRYSIKRPRGNGPSSWWQTVPCTDITVTLTDAGRALATAA